MSTLGQSAAYRIAFVYSAAFAAAILLLGVAVYVAADHDFRVERDRAIAEEVSRVAHFGDIATIARDINLRSGAGGRDTFLYGLFDPSGRRVAGAFDAAVPPVGQADVIFRDATDPADVARASTIQLANGYRLTVGIDPEPIERINTVILVLFGFAFAAVLAVGAAGALLLGEYLHRRLAVISETATAIIGGELACRIPVGPRGDEFDKVAGAVNAMLDRITGLMENLRQVSSDVAHDLRTPLVRLRGELALLGRDARAAERAVEQGDALLALFSAILQIAEVEGGGALTKRRVDLSALATEIAETYQPALADAHHVLEWSIAPGIAVDGDRQLLARAIINLLDNARIHTPPDTHVTIVLNTFDGRVSLSITDSGAGVPPEDRARIMERFARAEVSRTTPGHGLGLSMVRAVAGAHGGEVIVEDAAPGLRVIITLPEIERPAR